MKGLIAKLREQFDYIILDSPPFMAVTDSVVLSTLVDGVVMVTRYNKTPKEVVLRGKQKFSEVQAKVVGAIINAVDLKQEEYRYPLYSYYNTQKKKLRTEELAGVRSPEEMEIRPHFPTDIKRDPSP